MGCDDHGNPVSGEELSGQSSFNASCPFRAPSADSSVVAFYEDRRLVAGSDLPEVQLEMFEPGAEVVFRCVDIGERWGRSYKLFITDVDYEWASASYNVFPGL